MSKGKVLIIDDEIDLLETMRSRLDASGYDVATSNDGINGMEKAKEFQPDLIILDIMMPGIDGFETLKNFKSEASIKHIPIVVFSCGSEEEEWANRAFELGSVGYVVKPFDSDALLFTVEKFISKKGGK